MGVLPALAQRADGADNTSVTSPSSLTEVLAKLRERYAATAGTTLAALTGLADRLDLAPTDPETLVALHSALHRVHGTAGSYGFTDASLLADALEFVVDRWLPDPALDRERRAAIVRRFIAVLGVALATTTAADAPRAPRLIVAGLPDEVAAPLVVEGLMQGFHVERQLVAALAHSLATAPPHAVLAPAEAAVTVPEGVGLVLLRMAGAPPAASEPAGVVLDASTDPREVVRIVAARGGRPT